METPVGFGILGCGSIAPMHARALSGLSQAHLVSVADTIPERAQRLAANFECEWDEPEALLARDDIDAVCVCTPSGIHGELAATIAATGKHVVVEKPLDVSLPAADAAVRACREAGVVLSVISQHRWDLGARQMRQLVQKGKLGRVVLGSVVVPWFRTQAYYDSADWRGTRRYDGGALMNQGIHSLDLLRWFLGPVESVSAQVNTVAHRMEMEDVLVASLRFASGAIGSVTVTTGAFPGRPETISVYGTEGSATLEGGNLVGVWPPDLAPAESGEPTATAARGSANLAVGPHRDQLADVIAAIADKRPPFVGGEVGRDTLAVVLAVYRAAESGELVAPES